MLHIAFGLEDVGKQPEAQKMIDAALEVLKNVPDDHSELPYWLRPLLVQARAHMYRANNANIRKDDKDSVIHLIKNGGIAKKEEIEKELMAYWASFDVVFDELYKSKGRADVERPANDINTPEMQIKLASCLSAACYAQLFDLAKIM